MGVVVGLIQCVKNSSATKDPTCQFINSDCYFHCQFSHCHNCQSQSSGVSLGYIVPVYSTVQNYTKRMLEP